MAALKDYSRLARLRYDEGYAGYLEVLDADRSLFTAELEFARTQGSLLRALVNFYKAMGGGWVVEAETLTPEAASYRGSGAGSWSCGSMPGLADLGQRKKQ